MHLAENLERSAYYFPDRPAIFQENRKISFQEFNQGSNRVATALIGLGVRRGDLVALVLSSIFRIRSVVKESPPALCLNKKINSWMQWKSNLS